MSEVQVFEVISSWSENRDVRKVEVPVDELTDDVFANLEVIFHYGQNDFQSRPIPSMSVGDVVLYPHEDSQRFFQVKSVGFAEISEQQMQKFFKLPHTLRALAGISFG